MKIKLLSTALLGFFYIGSFFWPSSAGAQVFMMANSTDCLKGNGKLLEQKLSVAPFSGVSISAAFLVHIASGSKITVVTVKADENLLPFIDIEVKSGLLVMKAKRSICSENPIVVNVNVPLIDKILSEGASDISLVNLKNSRFDAVLNGSGVLDVTGETAWLNAVVSGSAGLRARDLHAEKVDIVSSGSSEAVICVGRELNAQSEGASEVIYYGEPQLLKVDERDVAEVRAAESGNTL